MVEFYSKFRRAKKEMTPEAEKLTQIFKFLREFEQLQNPACLRIEEYEFAKYLEDIPSHPDIQIALSTAGENSSSAEPLLRVRRPKLTLPPVLSAELREWLALRYDDPFKEPVLKESLTRRIGENEFVEEKFRDVPKRVEVSNAWLSDWRAWSELEKPNRRADEFFKWVYTLHGLLKRDSERYELILGDGILKSARDRVSHPLLLQKLSLEFDPAKPEFTLLETESPVEFDTQLLWALKDKDIEQIRVCNKEMAALEMSILDSNLTAAFLQRVVHGVVSDGQFYRSRNEAGEKAPPNSVHIYQAPVFFVRRRYGGFARALERILQDIPGRISLPPSLLQVCGLENPSLRPVDEEIDEPADPSSYYGNERKDILFTKPANQDQIKIIERLERHGTVLVQGPPGTGKSHTIGNLIGHLLAKGKRILVTAHTAKALRVVREQVVENLRPLCVSVLDDDFKSRDELEKAVAAVLERLAHSDPRHLRRYARSIGIEREKILAELAQVRQKALELRSNEYREICLAGRAFSPIEAAKLVKAGTGIHDWIPGPTSLDSPLPLTSSEIAALYNSNASITKAEEDEMAGEAPVASDLPTPDHFADLVNQSQQRDATDPRNFWTNDGNPQDLSEFEALLPEIKGFERELAGTPQWSFVLLSDGFSSEEVREKWVGLSDLITEVHQEFLSSQKSFLEFAPEVAFERLNHDLEDLYELSQSIATEASKRGKISGLTLIFKSKWKRFIRACQTNGRRPRKPEEFCAIRSLLSLKLARSRLVTRWTRVMEPFEEPPVRALGEEPETLLINFVEQIRWRLNWKQSRLNSFVQRLSNIGFDWEAYLNATPLQYDRHGNLLRLREALERLPETLTARAKAISIAIARAELEALTTKTAGYQTNPMSSFVARGLAHAIQERDVGGYRDLFDVLSALHQKESIRRERLNYLERLRVAAAGWAESIAARSPGHDQARPPGDVNEAWLWAQLSTAFQERASLVGSNIDERIEHLIQRLFHNTSSIVEAMAWASQIEHVEHNQQAKMALQGWLQTIKRIGKGKGKMVPALKAAAKKEMEAAKDAVPVWIMPLQRVLENFDPITAKFDVIIIDEASQCDMLGLVPLYMAEKVVIVGDHEQVSPEAVGEELDELGRLVTTHLDGIPQSHLYSGKQSVYELAQRAFSGHIMLREHFRCDPKIISFSNRLCYGGAVVPLRDTSRIQIKPPLIPHKVDGIAQNKVNREEATTIASLIAAALEQPEYQTNGVGQPVSMGAICMVGTEQAETIRKIILERLEPSLIERHRIVCGNASQFQGDERDVMFISVVDSPKEGGPHSLRTVDRFKQRCNVAASRAKDQMWVVYSLDPVVDLKPGDFRRQLIEHAIDPDAVDKRIEETLTHAQSEFERRVLTRLVGEGYNVIPQYQVGGYRIDMVVRAHDRESQLAVELDGEKFHPPSQLPADMERQAMLERAGWRFIRIRGSEFFRDEESALAPLYKKLQQFGITPGSAESVNPPANDELVERVRRRAYQIRQQWQETGKEDDNSQLKGSVTSPTCQNPTTTETKSVPSSTDRKNGGPIILRAPITLEKMAAVAKLSLRDVESVAWTQAFFTGKPDQPIPIKTAAKIANRFGIRIQE
jgi:very-short-patch-repair endonuclease